MKLIRWFATMSLGLMVVSALAACSVGGSTPYTVIPVPMPTDSRTPAPTTTAFTPSPSPATTTAKARPKASPAATPRHSPKVAAPQTKAAAPRSAPSVTVPTLKPTPVRPRIALSTLAWNNRSCLYQWDGVRWVFRNMCRTPQPNGAPDYAYRDDNDRLLFTATTSATLKLVWWTDAKLQYQQLTNSAPDAYATTAFAFQQASFNGIDLLSLDAFFATTAQKQQFQATHPGADLTPGTRNIQWLVFRSTWWPAISASNCTAAYLCP